MVDTQMKNSMFRALVGVAGFGYWGPKLVRNLSEMSDAQLTWVADLDQKRLQKVGTQLAGQRDPHRFSPQVAPISFVCIRPLDSATRLRRPTRISMSWARTCFDSLLLNMP